VPPVALGGATPADAAPTTTQSESQP